ncbi:Yip1 family protein [Oceanisphaera sp. KMM 10153]|uniref:Yip1 family protein n=1 Tax=Oceanisphaera submarina TaxID=3390193 RepID=UPI00397474B8
MILNHIWGLYAHPKEEWHTIDHHHERLSYSLVHLMFIALIPAVSAYVSATMIGWNFGASTSSTIMLTTESALMMSIGMYFTLIGGVFALAYLTFWMAKTFGANPSFTQSMELAAYTATPLFMTGLSLFYPEPIFLMMIGLAGLSYSVYLLYSGVPIIMHIPEERGFIYASSVVTCGLVLLVCIMVGSVIVWSLGFGPIYTH